MTEFEILTISVLWAILIILLLILIVLQDIRDSEKK